MKTINKTIKLKTKKYLEFIDLTRQVEDLINQSKIKNGFVTVFSRHTTVAIRINESEKGFFSDFEDFMRRLLPKESYYRHNDLNIRTENLVCSPEATDCLNGHSHCIHLLMGTSEHVPVIDGKMVLGIWQRIFMIELDSGRNREIIIQVLGK